MTAIRADRRGSCPICETAGSRIYEAMTDRIGEAPGAWNLSRCASCGLAWLDPMPRPEDIGKAYGGYFMHQPPSPGNREALRARLKRGTAAWVGGYGRRVSLVDRLLAAPLALLPGAREQALGSFMHLPATASRGRILDVGCATGAFLEHMRDLGWDVEGVEMEAGAARIAREERGLPVHEGSLEEQRFVAGSFDAVTLSHVIEHVPDPVATLRECRRLLRPDGRIVVTTPNLDSRGHARFRAAWIHLDPPRHLHLFTAAALRGACDRAGLKIRSLRSSVRWADGVYLHSREVERSGHGRMTRRAGLGARLAGVAFQHAEWLETFHDPWKGEELVLIAG